MVATFLFRRLTHALVAGTLAGWVLVAAPSPAHADPDGSSDPPVTNVTAGTNGLLVTTQQYFDSNGLPTSASLRASNGDGYFHRPDSNARTLDPEYSPDGARLAYSAFGGTVSAQGIWVITNPFGHVSNFQQLTTSQYDTDPTWSPDGSKIAFIRTQSGDGGIWMIDADGGSPVQILRGSFFGEDLTWSPDGTRIAFSNYSGSPFASPMHVYVMDVDGGTPVDLGLGSSPSWSPDGSLIAFQFPFSPSDIDIARMRPDGTDRFAVIGGTRNEYEPTWSPDGAHIAFLTADGVNTYTLATGALAQVFPGTGFDSTTWGAFQPTCLGRPATMSGTPGNDTLRGSRGVDVIHGMAGDDTILGLQGQDFICGGAGDDTVSFAGQTAPATAYIGETSPASGVSDLISTDVENLIGGSGPDTLVGDYRANVIEGGDGADQITAGGGADDVTGGRGDDRLVGGEGDDRIVGSGGDDVLVGDDGDDSMNGTGGDDDLRGGDGVDKLDGGLDSDLLSGGPGTDTADYGGRTIGVDVTIGGGGDDDGSREDGPAGERDRVRGSVENLEGGAGPDVLTGNDVGNRLTGGLGVDQLRGGAGRDVLRANDGVRDSVINCGEDTDAAAVVDGLDPAPISCP